MRRVSVFLAWYDLWVGAYWDRSSRALYLCPLPCVVIKVDMGYAKAPTSQSPKKGSSDA